MSVAGDSFIFLFSTFGRSGHIGQKAEPVSTQPEITHMAYPTSAQLLINELPKGLPYNIHIERDSIPLKQHGSLTLVESFRIHPPRTKYV